MNICLVVRAMPVHRLGGLEFHVLDLANALAGRGHGVTVVTSRHPKGIDEERLPSGVRVRYLQTGQPGDYSVGFFRGVEREVKRLEAAEAFDVIHAQEFAGLLLSCRAGRIVCTVHGTLFSETPLNRRFFRHLGAGERLKALWRFKPRIVLYPLFVRMLRRVDSLIVDSDYSRREVLLLDSQLRRKVSLVPLGVDLARYPADTVPAPQQLPAPELPLRIALLGRVQRMKGLEVALRAASLLHARRVAFRMVVGGSGEYLDAMRGEIAARGLEEIVELRGRIHEEDIPAFFAGADLFLFPDLAQPAFGLVAVEAMLYGLPVVAARSGAIPEVVGENVGWLYEPWNMAELAALLERLAGNRAEIAAKAAHTRSCAEQFTADRMASETEAVYLRLCGRTALQSEPPGANLLPLVGQ